MLKGQSVSDSLHAYETEKEQSEKESQEQFNNLGQENEEASTPASSSPILLHTPPEAEGYEPAHTWLPWLVFLLGALGMLTFGLGGLMLLCLWRRRVARGEPGTTDPAGPPSTPSEASGAIGDRVVPKVRGRVLLFRSMLQEHYRNGVSSFSLQCCTVPGAAHIWSADVPRHSTRYQADSASIPNFQHNFSFPHNRVCTRFLYLLSRVATVVIST